VNFVNVQSRHLDWHYNQKANVVKLSKGNTFEHEFAKFLLCWELLQTGKIFVTEAKMINNLRADIYVVGDNEVYEVVCTETNKSIEKKKRDYPVPVRVFNAREVIKRNYG
jgi:hypothetical protein